MLFKRQLDEELHPDGFNVGFNAGTAAGQTVQHLHVHVIPRFHGDMDDPRGGVRHVIPSRGNYVRNVDTLLEIFAENNGPIFCPRMTGPPQRGHTIGGRLLIGSQTTFGQEAARGHGHRAAVEEWIRRVMPDLHPIVKRLDELICGAIPGLQYAVKWKKAYYGSPEHGWIIEMVAYDVSANVVFFGGADFDSPPPLGTVGRSRYVKLKTLEEAQGPMMRKWIQQAGRVLLEMRVRL
jgi:hypothetical protein